MPPHITHFKMRGKPGSRQKVIEMFEKWLRDQRPSARGFVRADLSSNINDPDEFMAAACFADKKTYDANADSADQNAWYEELRSYLVDDPEWFDGTLERQRIG